MSSLDLAISGDIVDIGVAVPVVAGGGGGGGGRFSPLFVEELYEDPDDDDPEEDEEEDLDDNEDFSKCFDADVGDKGFLLFPLFGEPLFDETSSC